jgi:hypothetical protein
MLHCHLPHHMMNQMSSMVGPMSRRNGMPAGLDMERGMGMLRQGSASSEENGLSLGRGLGLGSTAEQRVSNSPLKAGNPMQNQDMPGMQHQGMQMGKPDVIRDANSVPGFPQDAFMEGPMMAMDQVVDKPENFGLRPGWSGFMAGMMTFVRVLLQTRSLPKSSDYVNVFPRQACDQCVLQPNAAGGNREKFWPFLYCVHAYFRCQHRAASWGDELCKNRSAELRRSAPTCCTMRSSLISPRPQGENGSLSAWSPLTLPILRT